MAYEAAKRLERTGEEKRFGVDEASAMRRAAPNIGTIEVYFPRSYDFAGVNDLCKLYYTVVNITLSCRDYGFSESFSREL